MISLRNVDSVLELRKRLEIVEDALERAERHAIASTFGAEMIHEINNPLGAITNLVYLLRSEPLNGTSVGYLDMVDEQICRMSAMTRQTLSFHRESIRPQRVDLVELMKIAIRTHAHRIGEKQLKFELDLPRAVEHEVFPGALIQVFSNLISNAIDASERGGRVSIRLRTKAKYVSVTVCDSGCGIPLSIRDSLFQPFNSGKEAGNGLGLWICRRIVEKHSGQILWRSSTQTEQSGTVFRISLGIAKSEEASFSEPFSAGDDTVRQRKTS